MNMGTTVTMNMLAMVPASAFGGFLYEASPVSPFILTMTLGATGGLIMLSTIKEPKAKGD